MASCIRTTRAAWGRSTGCGPEAGRGEPLLLSEGTGRILGRWVIRQIEETRRELEADGAPRRIEFRLDLARYGEDENRSLPQIVFG